MTTTSPVGHEEDFLDEVPAVPSTASGSSLRDRAHARRRQLAQRDSFVLPVEGYEDLGFYARYEVLDFKTLRRIGQKHERALERKETEVVASLAVAADTLGQACCGLLEKVGPGMDDKDFREIAPGFTPEAIREYFVDDLPEGTSIRQGIIAMFPPPRDALLTSNLISYSQRSDEVNPEQDQEMAGESPAP